MRDILRLLCETSLTGLIIQKQQTKARNQLKRIADLAKKGKRLRWLTVSPLWGLRVCHWGGLRLQPRIYGWLWVSWSNENMLSNISQVFLLNSFQWESSKSLPAGELGFCWRKSTFSRPSMIWHHLCAISPRQPQGQSFAFVTFVFQIYEIKVFPKQISCAAFSSDTLIWQDHNRSCGKAGFLESMCLEGLVELYAQRCATQRAVKAWEQLGLIYEKEQAYKDRVHLPFLARHWPPAALAALWCPEDAATHYEKAWEFCNEASPAVGSGLRLDSALVKSNLPWKVGNNDFFSRSEMVWQFQHVST